MAGLIMLPGLVAAIMLFRFAINFNKYWLIFIPLVGLVLLAIYNLELLTQLGTFFVRRCLLFHHSRRTAGTFGIYRYRPSR